MVDIPTLDIEDYDPDLNEEPESVEDMLLLVQGKAAAAWRKLSLIWDIQKR